MSERFTYIHYNETGLGERNHIMEKFKELEWLIEQLEDGRAKSMVYTNLEEAFMWAEKSIKESQVKRTKKGRV